MEKIKLKILFFFFKKEITRQAVIATNIGILKAYEEMQEYAESLNGTQSNEWCRLVYEKICKQKKSFSLMLDCFTRKD